MSDEINNEATSTEVEETTETSPNKDTIIAFSIIGLAAVGGFYLIKDKMVPFVRGKINDLKALKANEKDKVVDATNASKAASNK